MQYKVLATDYDGTLATDGHVDASTIDALHAFRSNAGRLVLVTGRIIDQLLEVFPQISLFDFVVADNGGLLFEPATGERVPLAAAASQPFIEELKCRGVPSIEVGDVIVATWEPYEKIVLEIIHDLGLELQIIFNKGAVMVLPTGVNKATGLRAALSRMGQSFDTTAGIGDAENDESFLRACGFSAAVDNALEVVKRQVDVVTSGARGAGVIEFIQRITSDDLASVRPRERAAEVR
jgi:hydroxymethylpyrimidine pyrophosphatase-like HAD family hydrolase